jgi:hypothetical protein
MGTKFLVIAGNGETTRVNVEALLEDYYRGNGKTDVVLLLPFQDRPSQGQVWAHQVSNDLGIPTTAIAPENSVIMSLGSASLHSAPNPISVVIEMVSGEDAKGFILWDEEDWFGKTLFSALQEASVPSYDLCMGLVELSHIERAVEPQEVVTAEISKPEIKVKVDLAELITKKVMEALKEAGVV